VPHETCRSSPHRAHHLSERPGVDHAHAGASGQAAGIDGFIVNEDIATVTTVRRNGLRILAKDVADYTRVAPHVDGNLYYWSSDDQTTNGGHQAKLTEIAEVVRVSSGLWIAPEFLNMLLTLG
jgi:hypothetical protein